MSERINVDTPPFSRVFVVCSKSHREEDVNAAFSQYGCVEDVWMVKDRMTKENKGICYIKFDRASSAALAIENLDGKVIGDEPKPIKVCPDYIWAGQSMNCPLKHCHRLHSLYIDTQICCVGYRSTQN